MSVRSPSRPAPYAPPATVLHVIHHFRQREVPETLSDTLLGQIGVKESVLRTVKQTLVFLKLIEEDGLTTKNFKALRFATDQDYPRLFRELVTGAYSDIFAIHDPETANRGQLLDAFRPFSPASQHDRMITLFLALCQEADLKIAQPPKQSSTQTSPRPTIHASAKRRRLTKSSGKREEQERSSTAAEGLLFGVTEADIAALDPQDFDEVWTALGKVARARALARTTTNSTVVEEGNDES